MTPAQQPTPETPFVDRRKSNSLSEGRPERRQFGNSHRGLSPDARELAEAIDGYKLQHRRRYITFEEMLQVIQSLGYCKSSDTSEAEPADTEPADTGLALEATAMEA